MSRSVRPPKTDDGEPQFTVELSPEVQEKTDRVLGRLQQGEREGIYAELLALARQHPLQHWPQFGLGVYELSVNNDPAAAAPFFERAVEIFPYFAEGHYNLAACMMKQGDVRKAVESYRKAIRYTGDADIANRAREQLKFMESLVVKNEPFATLEEYVANQELFEEAFASLSRRDFGPAAEGFRKVLQQNPNHVQSYGNLGLAYAGLGRKAEALKCLDKALELDPDYGPARSNRRIIERMEEGQPQSVRMAETRYYLQKHQSEKGREGVFPPGH